MRRLDAWSPAAIFQGYMRYEPAAWEKVGCGNLRRLDDFLAVRNRASKSGACAGVEVVPKGVGRPLDVS